MPPPYHSKGYTQYGAQMGRRTINANNYSGERLHLRRVPIDSGGYDPGGAYWGLGAPLYCAFGHLEGGDPVESYARAKSREEAKRLLADVFAAEPNWKR